MTAGSEEPSIRVPVGAPHQHPALQSPDCGSPAARRKVSARREEAHRREHRQGLRPLAARDHAGAKRLAAGTWLGSSE